VAGGGEGDGAGKLDKTQGHRINSSGARYATYVSLYAIRARARTHMWLGYARFIASGSVEQSNLESVHSPRASERESGERSIDEDVEGDSGGGDVAGDERIIAKHI